MGTEIQVIIYDPQTGEPYTEPEAEVQIWLPDNGRGDRADGQTQQADE